MNGRRAKAIRRLARQETIGMPEVDYEYSRHQYGVIVVTPHCTRAAVKMLKKQFKSGELKL